VEIALRAWQRFCADGSNVREIDLGVIRASGEEILFCCVAGVGMDAEANARANRMPQWLKGRGGYVLAALQSLAAFRPVEMGVKTAQREIRRPAFFVAVGNAHSYGGGMKVTPRALLDDGLLDVCVVSKLNKLKLLCWVPTIFFGGHLRLKQVEYFQAELVRIETERELELYADGDFACKTPVEIGVLSRALRVIVPV
jgi:diacylglycerol kinase (ATP)